MFLVILGAVILAAAGFAGLSNNNSKTRPPRKEIPKENQNDLADDLSSINTIIYGSKDTETTLISAVNDSGNNDTPVSDIESDVKFVIPLNTGKHLLYIGETDYGDMGANLKLKTIVPTPGAEDGTVKTIYSALDGYKIDRLIISENQEWITWYEVKPAGKSYTHESDYYRSFKANIKTAVSSTAETVEVTKLTDEKAEPNTVINLPSVITNNGDVYFDALVPSSYALYYGFKDEEMNNILPLNTYNSKPYFFDERYLLYTAYEPNNSRLPADGDKDSTREQIVNTNIVKIYDIKTGRITTAAPGDNGEQYKHPVYISGDPNGEFSIAAEVYKIETVLGRTKLIPKEVQLITYDGNAFKKEKLFSFDSGASYRILAVGDLSNKNKSILVGEETAFRGNIGTGIGIGMSGYKNMLKSIKVIDTKTKQTVKDISPVHSADFEFVSIMKKLPQEKLGIERNKKLVKEISTGERQLQLSTFVPVEPKRDRKNPRSECEDEWAKKGYPNYEACEACPVYIYNVSNELVTVRPKTPISISSAVPKLTGDIWQFKADRFGNLSFPDGIYKKIDYDFPRGSVSKPSYGVVLQKKELARGIADYAYSLGFNTRETEDIVDYMVEQGRGAEYVYLSHLSDELTKTLLNIEVLPSPQAYKSVIFYLKKLDGKPDTRPQTPQFSPFARRPYTVVVWGSVID